MTDTIDQKRRSENMRRIRSRDTSPEMKVRRLLHSMGYRYRLHVASLPGRPDIVFRRIAKIIEVRGCFWHQHPGCIDSHVPKTRRHYWEPKLRRNRVRDRENLRTLQTAGWKVLVVWECETGDEHHVRRRLREFMGRHKTLKQNQR